MAEGKVIFHVGVFGIGARIIDGDVKILVNVRTDQARQKEFAKLPPESAVLLVDCPGGTIKHGDKSRQEALEREILEELGCSFVSIGEFSQPLELMGDRPEPYDLASWKPVRFVGEIKPSNEAKDHPWVSRKELETADRYRPVSGLGLAGRTGRMMTAALDFFEKNRDKSELFS
jgi:hypothetical protein